MNKPLRRALYIDQQGRCHWCDKACVLHDVHGNRSQQADDFTIEHIVLHCLTHGQEKFVVGACYACNQLRNTILMLLNAGRTVDHLLQDNPDLRDKLIESVRVYVTVP